MSRLLAVCLVLMLGGCQLEQVQLGESFIVYTQPTGACPGLQWQFVVDAHRAIAGTLLQSGAPIARLSGTLAADDTFRMSATPPSGSPTIISGAITSQRTTFTIDGDVAGAGCNGQTLVLRGGQVFQGNSYNGGGGG